jgi:hypothetical protein
MSPDGPLGSRRSWWTFRSIAWIRNWGQATYLITRSFFSLSQCIVRWPIISWSFLTPEWKTGNGYIPVPQQGIKWAYCACSYVLVKDVVVFLWRSLKFKISSISSRYVTKAFFLYLSKSQSSLFVVSLSLTLLPSVFFSNSWTSDPLIFLESIKEILTSNLRHCYF